ncbi:MAG: hypothetical protein HYV26_11725 [Candidatus Hydrogenedentes bacterium]|nr:hypothetical protein [Candidatus Hydrogenedentota bacterium]
MTRRNFLTLTGSVITLALRGQAGSTAAAGEVPDAVSPPRVDLHVHLDNSTIEQVAALGVERGVKLGVVEHAGTKENQYPVVLSNDAELLAFITKLEGKGVYKGIQAEWIDWAGCFSKETLKQLDYVLSDAMTMPGPNGKRMKLWDPAATIGPAEEFMEKYVAWHVQCMAQQPLDIFGNTTWLPDALMPQYDILWTEARMQQLIEAAVKHNVALEISSWLQLPKLPFLRLAKEAGAKFSFGSNGRYPKMGLIDYCLESAAALQLTPADIYLPSPLGPKAARA